MSGNLNCSDKRKREELEQQPATFGEQRKQEEAHPQRYQGKESACFKLADTCLLFIHRGDITKWTVDGHTDAIVNAANKRLHGGGGVDGAIHRAAGPDLLKACRQFPKVSGGIRCPVGSARITRGFDLPVSHIIHTVGPVYDMEEDPGSKLSDAYRSSLNLTRENEVKYIAFPAISCGIYGYPYEEAAAVSLTTVRDCTKDLKEVRSFILYGKVAFCNERPVVVVGFLGIQLHYYGDSSQRFELYQRSPSSGPQMTL